MTPGPSNATDLLLRWNHGETKAMDRLIPCVYEQLRSLAAAYMYREDVQHTMRSTDLVHEVYLNWWITPERRRPLAGAVMWYAPSSKTLPSLSFWTKNFCF